VILLDTHPLIWFTQGHKDLGPKARQIVQRSLDRDEARVSPITFWETSMLVNKGRLALGRSVQEWAQAVLGKGIILAEVSPHIAIGAGDLPRGIHGDPADRIIIATARTLGCPILTADRKILSYASAGHVAATDARR
jgi:PIN domain nuclease of toxin-antitoxin system